MCSVNACVQLGLPCRERMLTIWDPDPQVVVRGHDRPKIDHPDDLESTQGRGSRSGWGDTARHRGSLPPTDLCTPRCSRVQVALPLRSLIGRVPEVTRVALVGGRSVRTLNTKGGNITDQIAKGGSYQRTKSLTVTPEL